MIPDILSKERLNRIVTELFIWGRILNIFLVFVTRSYFPVPKIMTLNSTHNFIMKIWKKPSLRQIGFNHSSNIDFKDLMNLFRKCTAEPYSFSVDVFLIDVTLASDNRPSSRKNLLDRV